MGSSTRQPQSLYAGSEPVRISLYRWEGLRPRASARASTVQVPRRDSIMDAMFELFIKFQKMDGGLVLFPSRGVSQQSIELLAKIVSVVAEQGGASYSDDIMVCRGVWHEPRESLKVIGSGVTIHCYDVAE